MSTVYVSPLSSWVYDQPNHRFNQNPDAKPSRHIFHGYYTKIGKTSGDCSSRNKNTSFYQFCIAEHEIDELRMIGRLDTYTNKHAWEHYEEMLISHRAWEIHIGYEMLDVIERLAQAIALKRHGRASDTYTLYIKDRETGLYSYNRYSYHGYTETFNCTVPEGRACVMEAMDIIKGNSDLFDALTSEQKGYKKAGA